MKKSRVGLYCKFLKDAGTAKKLPKSGPEHHETSPAPFVFMWLSGSGMWHSVDDGTGSTQARPPRTGPFGSGTVATGGRLFFCLIILKLMPDHFLLRCYSVHFAPFGFNQFGHPEVDEVNFFFWLDHPKIDARPFFTSVL